MIVKCIKNKADHGGSDGWITVSKTYEVIEILHEYEPSRIEYRLIGDDKHTPGYHNSNLFEIIDNRIPPNWSFKIIKTSSFLRPRAWIKDDFWEAYFNQEEWAEDIFDQEVQKIKEFHSKSQ